MATENIELISQLRTAITGWTSEVGAAQEGLNRQIDGANTQLTRLLELLQQRNEHAVALTQANAEIERLRRSIKEDGLPPGALTQYTASPAPATPATRELVTTFDRLQSAVQSWTMQVTHSQVGLSKQFSTANGQLHRLLELLGAGGNGSADSSAAELGGSAADLQSELERLQHENSVLSSEVYALNIELESLRRGQEEFASANLAAETERVLKQRRELEELEDLLRVREEELADSQRGEKDLAREIESLRADIGRREVAEERLQQTVDLQRRETEQHLAALTALTREMEALRRAFLGEGGLNSEAVDDVVSPSLGDAETETVAADEQVSALEAKVAQLELEREEVQVLKERIEALQEQIRALEDRPASEELESAHLEIASLQSQVAALEAQASDTSELESAHSEIASLQSQVAVLEAQASDMSALESARAEVEALRSRIADLETVASDTSALEAARSDSSALQEKLQELEVRVQELEVALAQAEEAVAVARAEKASLEASVMEREAQSARLEDLEAARADVAALEAALEAAQAQAASFSEASAELGELQAELAAIHAQNTELSMRPEAAALETALAEVAALNQRVADLEDQLAAAARALEVPGPEVALVAEQQAGLRTALASMEGELAALRRREEEAVASARTLLEELESHRTYEAAQEESLSKARGEIARLQTALDEAQRQAAESGAALAEAEARLNSAFEDAGAAEEAEGLREQVEGLQAALAAQEAQAAEERSARDEELASSSEKIAALQDELESFHVQARGAEAAGEGAIAALRDEMEAAAAAHAAQSKKLADERDEAWRQVEVLEAKLAEVAAGADQSDLLKKQAAELQEYRETQVTAEKWIADLETQLADAQARHDALFQSHRELEGRYDDFANQLNAVRAQEGTRGSALDDSRAETESVRRHAAQLEDEIARLNGRLAEAAEAAASELDEARTYAEAERAELRGKLESAQSELTALREQVAALTAAREALAGTAAAYEEALAAESGRGAELNEELSRAAATLGAQQLGLAERDEQITALRQDIVEMEQELRSLIARETESRSQTMALSGTLDTMKETDARYREELEKNRSLLEELRAEHTRQQAIVDELSARGTELESLLQTARDGELTTLATVDELQGQLKEIQEKEQAEADALAEARALLTSQQDALATWETQVSALEARIDTMTVENSQLSQETAQQQEEIREAMAQVSQAVQERNEALEELEAEKVKKGRLSAGLAGETSDYSEARQERSRQQNILVSELTQADPNRNLGQILVDAGILSSEQLEQALEAQQKDPSQLLGTILIEREFATDDAIAQAVACQLQKPVVNPMEVHIQQKAISALNKDVCTWHVCVPLRMTTDRMVVVMANPLDESAILKLRDVSQREITAVVGTPTHIMGAIEECYGSF